MTDRTEDLQAWCKALFEETLFRAAAETGDGPAVSEVPVSLPIAVRVDGDGEDRALNFTLHSIPDGPVTLRLAWPFPELGTR